MNHDYLNFDRIFHVHRSDIYYIRNARHLEVVPVEGDIGLFEPVNRRPRSSSSPMRGSGVLSPRCSCTTWYADRCPSWIWAAVAMFRPPIFVKSAKHLQMRASRARKSGSTDGPMPYA